MAKAPTEITGLVEWWDPDDITGTDGDAISSWTGSQNSLVLSQGTPAQQPELVGSTRSITGHQMAAYYETDIRLAVSDGSLDNAQVTYLLIVCPLKISPNGWFISKSNSGNPYTFRIRNSVNYLLSIARDGQEGTPDTVEASSYVQKCVPHLLVGHYDGTTLSLRINGVEVASTEVSGGIDTDSPGDLVLGNHPSSNVAGSGMFGDLVIYDNALGGTDLQELEEWLIDRWAIDTYDTEWTSIPSTTRAEVGGSDLTSPCIRELDASTWIMFACLDDQVDYWTAPKNDPHNWTRNTNGVIIDAATDSLSTCRAVSAVLDGSTWHILVDDTGSFYHFTGSDLQNLTDNGEVFTGQGSDWESHIRHPYIATTKVGSDWALYYDGRDGSATSGFGAIGVVYTEDFATFTNRQQVLTASSLWWEATDVGAPAVWRRDNKWEMVYSGFNDDHRPVGFPHFFGLAHSDDGVTWTKLSEQVPILMPHHEEDVAGAINAPEMFDDGTNIHIYYLTGPGIGIDSVQVGQAFLDTITLDNVTAFHARTALYWSDNS